MRKVFVIVSLALFLGSMASCEPQRGFRGEIIMTNPNLGIKSINDYNHGFLIFNPSNNSYLYVAKEYRFTSVSFSDNKKKILGLSDAHKIVEYDLQTKTMITVYEGDNAEACYDYVKYIPQTECISFKSYPNLFIFNRKTQERKILFKVWGDYSWTKDGKKLYYSIEGKTYCLDMISNKTSLYINDGFEPQLSPSNDYIAYMNLNNEIIVKEIKTGKMWRYQIPIKLNYCKFSPDDKYLAFIEQTPYKNYAHINLIGWDFRDNKIFKLIENIYDGSLNNFDWK